MDKKISYKKSGVDLKFANAIVPKIRKLISGTRRPEVLADIGPFAALFQLRKYKSPVLVASADGVGTKLAMALKLRALESIGVDPNSNKEWRFRFKKGEALFPRLD